MAATAAAAAATAPRPPSPSPSSPTLPVAVVVVTWNSAAVIDRCLAAATAQRPAEIVVVDNASTDATRARLATWPQARVLPQPHNTGFAAASNLGIAASRTPFVLLLNDDAVLGPSYLALLLATLRARPDAASATGKLWLPGGRDGERYIDSAGIAPGRHALRPLDRGHGARDRGQYDGGVTPIFGPSAAAAVYRRAALAPLGPRPLCEALFAYYEDVDLAWQLRWRGWRHLLVPAAHAEHGRRGPGAKPAAIAVRAFVNRYTVWRRNVPPWRLALTAPWLLAWEAVRLARLGRRDPARLRAILAAAPAAWRRGAPPQAVR